MDDSSTRRRRVGSGRLLGSAVVLGWLIVLDAGIAPRMSEAAESSFWSPPLEVMPAETAAQTLVVIVVTDDVASRWLSTPAQAPSSAQSSCWCQRALVRSISRVPEGFSHPSAPIVWQHWPLGLPPILNGGSKQPKVGRAIIFVTDGKYRLLGLFVGVPKDDELTELIQDSEDVRRLLQQYSDNPDRLVAEIAEQCRERLPRLWRIEMDRQLRALGTTPADRIADVFQENEKFTDQVLLRIRLVAEQVQNVYLKDVQLRFGLTRADDIHRLTVLEQHSATRKPWSACVLPFVVGGDARMLGTELAEIVWNQRAMPIRPSDGDSLATWISHRDDRSPFALLIALPGMQGRTETARADVSETARRHGLGWDDLDQTVRGNPIRETEPDELAAWLSQHGGRPIDLQRPSNVRYLFFRSRADRPFPIRDGDPPGPSISMIRQVQK